MGDTTSPMSKKCRLRGRPRRPPQPHEKGRSFLIGGFCISWYSPPPYLLNTNSTRASSGGLALVLGCPPTHTPHIFLSPLTATQGVRGVPPSYFFFFFQQFYFRTVRPRVVLPQPIKII